MRVAIFKDLLKKHYPSASTNVFALRKFRYSWESFSNWCDTNYIDPLKANNEDIYKYKEYLESQGFKSNTIRYRVNFISRMLNLRESEIAVTCERFN